jgi:hypothetical protein
MLILAEGTIHRPVVDDQLAAVRAWFGPMVDSGFLQSGHVDLAGNVCGCWSPAPVSPTRAKAAASGRDRRTAGDMAAVLYWRLPELAPVDPGPLPWLPGTPPTLHAHPVWGPYLAKRSQLVADLADQVKDHACQGDAKPAWAPLTSHLSSPLVREIAVWRAANGINPQDPRRTRGTQLETLPALWKQRLDRDIARAIDQPANARADERQAAHTALRRGRDDRQRPSQTPERRPSGPSAPSR